MAGGPADILAAPLLSTATERLAVGTTCPVCKLMFDDAVGNMGVTEVMAVKDIAHLAAGALEDWRVE